MSDDFEQQQSPEQETLGGPDRKWVRRLLPILVIAIGAAGTIAMVKSRKRPKRKARVDRGLLVETMKVSWQRRTVRIASNGVIGPRREVTIAPQVNGKVIWVSPALVVGGLIKKNAPLLRIDAQDYRLAQARAEAAIANAQRQLAIADSNALIARQEWKRLGSKSSRNKATPLTLHEPQLKAARAGLASARADLMLTKINLGRTTLRAPFNLRVRKKMVDIGQYVRLGQILANVYGTDVAEAIVSLPIDEMRWLKVPRASGTAKKGPKGPEVIVKLRTGKGHYQRKGVLVRSVGEVDRTGRMSKVVVAIPDPYNLERKAGAPYLPDFEIGAFVEVLLPGEALEKVMAIPAETLRMGNVVHVVGKDNRLAIKPVKVVRRDNNEALIASGLDESDRLITTQINGAVEGLKLRLKEPRATEVRASIKSKDKAQVR